jgi:hypothetical protein
VPRGGERGEESGETWDPPSPLTTPTHLSRAILAEVDSAIHPDTGDEIPLLFRMSLFMPANLPITAGMLLSGTGLQQVFWQWLNQSYNAGFNYGNRNATVPIDTAGLMTSYGVATGVACGMSYGLGKVVDGLQKRVGGTGPQPFSLKLLMRGLPWMAVASAGMANAVAMRYKEAVDGITVYDQNGTAVGTSVAAGRACLLQVALTRAALPVPILLIPPFVLDAVSTTSLGRFMARSAGAKLGVELSIFAFFLQAALPFAVALFPQTGTIRAEDLEPEFRNRGIATYTYNKGV